VSATPDAWDPRLTIRGLPQSADVVGANAALSTFVDQGAGTLVNVASIDSEVPLALQNTYAATKAGVLSLTRSLNQELRLCGHDDTINVADIMPWAVDTRWWATPPTTPATPREWLRWMTPRSSSEPSWRPA
jgi:short-subunit dehydrogenase